MWMTMAEVLAELGVARSTTDDWRAHGVGSSLQAPPKREASPPPPRVREVARGAPRGGLRWGVVVEQMSASRTSRFARTSGARTSSAGLFSARSALRHSHSRRAQMRSGLDSFEPSRTGRSSRRPRATRSPGTPPRSQSWTGPSNGYRNNSRHGNLGHAALPSSQLYDYSRLRLRRKRPQRRPKYEQMRKSDTDFINGLSDYEIQGFNNSQIGHRIQQSDLSH